MQQITPLHTYEVIIAGGSYAGLSSALTLGRSLRRVLVIDDGKPCNRQTPHSHNFLTQDGETPAAISDKARKQVLQYPTITIKQDTVREAVKTGELFTVTTASGERYSAQKLLFATGVRDMLPPIPGMAECWGISVIHCPYCHGYEVSNQPVGILANGQLAFEFCKMIAHWNPQLTLLTNGPGQLDQEQRSKLEDHNISVIEQPIKTIEHKNGQLTKLVFEDYHPLSLVALYAKPDLQQSSGLPAALGCKLDDDGLLEIDPLQRTSVAGVYAAGDNSSLFRSVAGAVAAGLKAGATINRDLIEENF